MDNFLCHALPNARIYRAIRSSLHVGKQEGWEMTYQMIAVIASFF